MAGLTIGKVAERAGVKIDTLRYYEREDVIAKPSRNGSNYRLYPESTIRQVRFVKRAQELGFSLAEIRELLEMRLKNHAGCDGVHDQALAKVDALDRKIRALQAMRRALMKLAKACPADGPVDECPILDALDERREV